MYSSKKYQLLLLIIIFSSFQNLPLAKKIDDIKQLKEDMAIVWPLTQTVKIEYDLVNAQLEFCKTDDEKKVFMEKYEEFIKENYFKQVLSLNLRQGKLLLLLIDRELGKTPFELLKENLSLKRAIFWQRFAKLIGADLREEYIAEEHPLIEEEVRLIKLKCPIY